MFETLARVMTSPTDSLKVACEGCGRRKSFSRAEAFKVFGADAAPYDIRGRVRCSGCGRSGFAKVWI